jgi:hypothetical protein
MKAIMCPVAGKIVFTNRACQPLVQRHTPIFQNHRHRYGGSCVHEQTRTRHGSNAKKALPRCINFFDSGTGSGGTFSEDADFCCNFVPRHLEQKRNKYVLFSIGRIISLQPIIISCKEIQMKDNRSSRNRTNQAEQNRKRAAPNEMDPFATS